MTGPLPEIPLEYLGYLRRRWVDERARTEATLTGLTDRERALVREAAVMGFVRGARYPRDVDVPPDSAIVAEVVYACRAFPDLHPLLGGRAEGT